MNVNKMNCDIFELFYENCVNVQGPQNIGKGANINIFMFTGRKNNGFQRKLMLNMNI